jgi:hypothetical protein
MQRAKAWKALEVVIEQGQSPESPVPSHGSRLAHPIVPSALGIAIVLERLESNLPHGIPIATRRPSRVWVQMRRRTLWVA